MDTTSTITTIVILLYWYKGESKNEVLAMAAVPYPACQSLQTERDRDREINAAVQDLDSGEATLGDCVRQTSKTTNTSSFPRPTIS